MGDGSDRLIEIKNSNDPQFLIGVFRQGTGEEREAAADRFVSLPEDGKYVQLMLALRIKNPSIRKWVAITVERAQQSSLAPQLVGLLSDKHPEVRETAFSAVSSLLEPEMLMRLVRSDYDSAKSEVVRGRLKPFLDKAVQSEQMKLVGMDRIDMMAIRKLGKPLVLDPDYHPDAKPQPRKKAFA